MCYRARRSRDKIGGLFQGRRLDDGKPSDWEIRAHERAAIGLHAGPVVIAGIDTRIAGGGTSRMRHG